MGSIINRDGRWRAQVRRKGKSQCRTFGTKAAAQAWVRQAESVIDNDLPTLGNTTVGEVLRAYRKMRELARPISDSSNEHYMLRQLERGLGHYRLARITPDDMVAHATMRREEGAGPYTINMEISKLGTALRYGAASLRISPPDVVGAARPLLNHLRLIGGGGKRERRPTEDELTRLLEHLRRHRGEVYADAAEFASISAMRLGEICALAWDDLEPEVQIARVKRKHPRLGKVLERVPVLGRAWAIVQGQPRSDERIFPVQPGTLSKYFTEGCRVLFIPDLHFHDLRHEGASRLFEEGLPIEQVALVTGHKSWNMLRRYTQLKPESLTKSSASRPGAEPPPGSPPSASPRPSKSRPGKTPR